MVKDTTPQLKFTQTPNKLKIEIPLGKMVTYVLWYTKSLPHLLTFQPNVYRTHTTSQWLKQSLASHS